MRRLRSSVLLLAERLFHVSSSAIISLPLSFYLVFDGKSVPTSFTLFRAIGYTTNIGRRSSLSRLFPLKWLHLCLLGPKKSWVKVFVPCAKWQMTILGAIILVSARSLELDDGEKPLKANLKIPLNAQFRHRKPSQEREKFRFLTEFNENIWVFLRKRERTFRHNWCKRA